MKVYAYVMIVENKNSQGRTRGDIVYFYPLDVPQAKLDIQDFAVVVVDIKIPCGDNFRKRIVDQANAVFCGRCEYNDVDLCDNIKYKVATWSAGGLFVKPKTTGYRYKIDISKFMSVEDQAVLINREKTEQQKTEAWTLAQSNEQPKTIIEDKLESR